MKKTEKKQNEQIVMKISFWSMVVNVILSAAKLLAGFIANSTAMISDGIHSASDVLSTIVVIIGYKYSAKESDENHPYGHERLECVAAIILAVLLCLPSSVSISSVIPVDTRISPS